MNCIATSKESFAQKSKVALVCLLLAGGIGLVFGQTLHQDFVNYDDQEYVSNNLEVHRGLTFHGIAWAFTHVVSANWHPLTMMSHMLAWEFFGAWAGGHHLVNVLLHIAVAILLFLVLREMTGALWRSAFVAALFAIHPLRAESVAWISERKDVLSGVFFMLTLWSYTRYARNPPAFSRYLLVMLCFALGLMSKPALVTVPFVLLLLDYWPLNRFASSSRAIQILRCFLEKLPFLVLAGASSIATVLAQRGHVTTIETGTVAMRISNAAVSYAAYIGQMIYPVGMTPFYPFPYALPIWEVALSGFLLLSVSAAALLGRKKYPFILVGWLWYLGMLVPMIGLIGTGGKARADRYSYLSQIGLSVLVTWTLADVFARRPRGRAALGFAAAGILALFMACAHAQVSYWRNSEALWAHAIAVNPRNVMARCNLATVFSGEGRATEAILQYQAALKIDPDESGAENNLGAALIQQGKIDEAIPHYQRATQIQPNDADFHGNLGIALAKAGRIDEAISEFRSSLALAPESAEMHKNLGKALMQSGAAHVNEAVSQYRKAVEIQPESPAACNDLAWTLATCPQASLRNGAEAVALALKANRLSGGNEPSILDTLAAAYAEAGDFAGALNTARKALDLANRKSDEALATEIRMRIKQYESGSPWHH